MISRLEIVKIVLVQGSRLNGRVWQIGDAELLPSYKDRLRCVI